MIIKEIKNQPNCEFDEATIARKYLSLWCVYLMDYTPLQLQLKGALRTFGAHLRSSNLRKEILLKSKLSAEGADLVVIGYVRNQN